MLINILDAKLGRPGKNLECLRAGAVARLRVRARLPNSTPAASAVRRRPSGVLKMAVPRRKTSPSRRGMRRSADALKRPSYIEDKDSGELRRPHHIDLKTGMYKGRQVLKVKTEA